MRYVFKILVLTYISFFSLAISADAQTNFNKAKFDVTHTITSEGGLETQLKIGISDVRQDIEISKFEIILPKNIKYYDLTATSNHSRVNVTEESVENGNRVILSFDNPVSIKEIDNLLEVSYRQKDFLLQNGTATELILPTFATEDNATNVTFDTSALIDKKLTISKPRPNHNEQIIYRWQNVISPSIYLVFGDYQTYKLNLKYHLSNDRFVKVKQEIAFPPETALQHIIVSRINPKPDEIFIDSDGNYLGRYILDSHEKINVTFDGVVRVYAVEQENMIPYIRNQFKTQKSFLLAEKKYWEITNTELLKASENLTTASDIYDYVVNTLSYSFESLKNKKVRFGADQAHKLPNQAVCMEYTDLFVAISRLNGVYSREIQGYGYSDDSRLRPLSLSSDILHAWPEYYDLTSEKWVPLDPTWQDTSKIDYRSGFDLNHIVLAIHGADSVYPLPAGMYKKGNTKDVDIHITNVMPNIDEEIIVRSELEQSIYRGEKKLAKLVVKNTGNVFIKNKPISIKSDYVNISTKIDNIYLLAPGQSMEIPFEYSAKNGTAKNVNISIDIGEMYKNSFSIKIMNKSSHQLISFAKLAIVVIVLLSIVAFIFKKA